MRDTHSMEAANMKIKNIEIKSAAVEIRALHPFEVSFCDGCDDEAGLVEVEIKTCGAHLHMAMGPYCTEKYLRAFA